jgi:hypothetical protein
MHMYMCMYLHVCARARGTEFPNSRIVRWLLTKKW